MNYRNVFAVVAVVLATLMMAGCANLNSINRSWTVKDVTSAKIVTVDAKQRHLFLIPDATNASSGSVWRICAEAAPDVFSALASSGSLTLDLSSNPSGEAGFSMAETAATIQRTQSINLIRESFYRTCERYASGAMTKTQFIVQAARDQRGMVSILAIEQLTGAVRPAATIISGPGTQSSALSGEEAAALVKDYRERRDTAEATHGGAKTAYDAAQTNGGVCADGDAKDETKCAELKLANDNTKKAFDDAQKGLDNAMALAKNMTNSASSSSLTGANSSAGITMAEIGAANLAAVSAAVVEITKAAVINEPLMFCVAMLTEGGGTALDRLDDQTKTALTATCLNILADQAKVDREFVADEISFERGRSEAILANYFNPALAGTERERRATLMVQAMRTAKLGQSNGDLIRILAQGPDAVRTLLLTELRKIEKDINGTAALN